MQCGRDGLSLLALQDAQTDRLMDLARADSIKTLFQTNTCVAYLQYNVFLLRYKYSWHYNLL
jgi:hypothetical protein